VVSLALEPEVMEALATAPDVGVDGVRELSFYEFMNPHISSSVLIHLSFLFFK